MRAVAMGSSAEHGSSISSTSGSTAMARAMQRRCCWPPDRPMADCLQLVLDLVPQRGLAQRLLDDVVHARLLARRRCGARRRCCRRSTWGRGWASGTPCRCAAAPRPGRPPGRRGRRRGSGSCPRPGPTSIRSFIRLKQRSTVVLPQPDGPMNAVISCWRIDQGDVAHRPEVAVEDRQVADVEDDACAARRPAPSGRCAAPIPRRRAARQGARPSSSITGAPFR